MKLHDVQIPGGRVEALESSGEGPTVVLCHGNSGSAGDFLPLMRHEALRGFRLVSISLPGHGASAPAEDPMSTYSMEGFGAAVTATVEALGCNAYWAVGQSLGGHVLLESLASLRGAQGLVLLSAPPVSPATFSQAFRPDPTGGALFTRELSDEQVERFVHGLANTTDGAVARQLREGIRRTDPLARECLGLHLGQGHMQDERNLFGNLTQPVMLLGGTEDALLNKDYYATLPSQKMWGHQPVWCQGQGHALHLMAVDQVAHSISEFIAAYSS